MDIREKIYTLIQAQGGADYRQKKTLAAELSEANSAELIQDLERFYQGWLDAQHIKEYTEERARLEYVQETCFEVACEALALQGNPSIIPYFLKYVPTDDWDPKIEVNMEDYNEQNLERCIVNPDYYGEAYIPVLLAHIHELVPEKMLKADKFLYTMLLDDLDCFEATHPLFSNLSVAKKEPFMKLLDFSLQTTLEETSRERKVSIEVLKEEIPNEIQKIIYKDSPLIKVAYLRQEFLKLYAAD